MSIVISLAPLKYTRRDTMCGTRGGSGSGGNIEDAQTQPSERKKSQPKTPTTIPTGNSRTRYCNTVHVT